MSDAAATPRRPGRPRSADADRAILGAALGLAAEVGLARMTIERVAARAGVGKATIYRRWDSKEALFADALRSIAAEPELPVDTGSLRSDWLTIVGAEIDQLLPRGVHILPRLLAEAAGEPELHRLVYDKFVAPRRAVATELLRRAIARDELRADLDLDLTIDMLIGPVVYRALISGGDPEQVHGMSERLLDALLAGLGS